MHRFFETLEKEHQEVQEILEHLEETSAGDVKTREKHFQKLKEALIPHMKGEEAHFYPALKADQDAREQALESLEEHHVAELILGELNQLPKDAENWGAKLSVFKEIIDHHIEEEEEEVWEVAEEALDENTLNQMMESFLGEKHKARQQIK